MVDELLLI